MSLRSDATDGLIDWTGVGTPSLQNPYFNSTGENFTVDGVRVQIPYTLGFFGAIQYAGALVQNSMPIASMSGGIGSTQANNKTNAQWAADCATY